MPSLRSLQESDEVQLLTWRNLPEVSRYMYSDHIIGADEHRAWFQAALADPTRKHWIVELDGEAVGMANVVDISHRHSRASWAFYLASDAVRGRGVGSFVEFQVLSYVFEELRLNRLGCEVLAFNDGVVAMHEKFGFTREGTLRAHIRKGEEFIDVVLLGMLRSEWHDARPRLERRLREKGLL